MKKESFKLKADLITIIPSIILEDKIYESGTYSKNKNLVQYLEFNNSRIFNFTYLLKDKEIIDKNFFGLIERFGQKLINLEGEQLRDFTIIIDRNITIETFNVKNLDCQEILSFVAYQQNLNRWLRIDFIKILQSKGNILKVFINNNINDTYSLRSPIYVLPQKQDYFRKISIHKKSEVELIKVLEKISQREEETYKRLISSIIYYNEAHRLNFINSNLSIVFITVAIEQILEILPYSINRTVFGQKVSNYFEQNSEINDWAINLYAHRGDIIHNGPNIIFEENLSFFEIAKKIFYYLFIKLLEGKGLLEITGEEYFNKIEREILRSIVPNKGKIEKIFSEKDNYNFKEFKKDEKLYEKFITNLELLSPGDITGQEYIIELVYLLFSVLKDIINDEAEVIEGLDVTFKEDYKNRLFELYDKCNSFKLNNFKELKDPKIKIEFRDFLREIIDFSFIFGPSPYDKNEFKMSVSEFLGRAIKLVEYIF